MTVLQVITVAAQKLGDSTMVAWTSTDLLDKCKMALYRLFRDRADLLLVDAGLLDHATAIEALATTAATIPGGLGHEFKEPLANLIAHYAFLEDSDAKENANRAAAHLALYERGI